jgi:hypothetical protein
VAEKKERKEQQATKKKLLLSLELITYCIVERWCLE